MTIVVTVVLPLVPVMATIGRSSHTAARSSSVTVVVPRAALAAKAGCRSGQARGGHDEAGGVDQCLEGGRVRCDDEVDADVGGSPEGRVARCVVGDRHLVAAGEQGARDGLVGEAEPHQQHVVGHGVDAPGCLGHSRPPVPM